MNSVAIHKPTINVADDYRYKRFTTGLLFRDLRFRKDAGHWLIDEKPDEIGDRINQFLD